MSLQGVPVYIQFAIALLFVLSTKPVVLQLHVFPGTNQKNSTHVQLIYALTTQLCWQIDLI